MKSGVRCVSPHPFFVAFISPNRKIPPLGEWRGAIEVRYFSDAPRSPHERKTEMAKIKAEDLDDDELAELGLEEIVTHTLTLEEKKGGDHE